ncbi:MAG: glycosyltransferase [Candidatus Eremiobacteraeota bacterium]|nr:glycosyltransferase [Candidatus Eremiobacteraeota bacterium]
MPKGIISQYNSIKFSVIIPAFNAASFIEKALDSVRFQSYNNYEVIITNDGSTDGTEKIVKEYLESYDSFPAVLLNQQNKGLGGARNTAISEAKGDFLAFLDADDIWYPHKLCIIGGFLLNNPHIDIICHNEVEVSYDGKKRVLNYGMLKKPYYEDLLFNGNRLSPSATIVRSELLKKSGGFSEEVDFLHGCEDYDLWLKLAKEGASFANFPEVLGEYYRIPGALTSKIEAHSRFGYNVRQRHLNALKEEGVYSSHFLKKMADKISREYLYTLARAFFHAGDHERARKYYREAINESPLWWKPYAGILQLYSYNKVR